MIPDVETERLKIRHFAADDWQAVYRYTSDPAVMAYMPEEPFTEADAQAFVAKHGGEDAQAFAVVLKAEGRLIGHIIFHPWFAPRTYEVGWAFDRAYQGRGYATEAAAAFLRYGFESLGLHRIIATCQPENVGSCRVMEKLGMRREGLFKQCIYRGENTWWDEYFYAMLEDEWKADGGR